MGHLMPLVPVPQLLSDARSGEYAVGYFEAWDSYSLEAVVDAAEAERAPVILGFGCLLVDRRWLDDGGIETLGCLGARAAECAHVPVSLILNEAHTLEHARRGIDAGFNAVMLCEASLDTVAQLVQVAHDSGAAVEGELGRLPEGDSSGRIDRSHARMTDPDEAASYLAATGVDALAVSFGNVHTLEGGLARVDLDRLEAICQRVDVPLAVHGGTGFPANAVQGAIERGVAKFNVGTALKRAYIEGLRSAIAKTPAEVSPHELIGSHRPSDVHSSGKNALTEVVRRLIRLYGGSNRAPSWPTEV
jgi:ketose-bisphosphate aldolase